MHLHEIDELDQGKALGVGAHLDPHPTCGVDFSSSRKSHATLCTIWVRGSIVEASYAHTNLVKPHGNLPRIICQTLLYLMSYDMDGPSTFI